MKWIQVLVVHVFNDWTTSGHEIAKVLGQRTRVGEIVTGYAEVGARGKTADSDPKRCQRISVAGGIEGAMRIELDQLM
jgi:hypothetical protein